MLLVKLPFKVEVVLVDHMNLLLWIMVCTNILQIGQQMTTFSAPDGDYDVYVRDASGCTSFDIATIISLDPDLAIPIFAVSKPM